MKPNKSPKKVHSASMVEPQRQIRRKETAPELSPHQSSHASQATNSVSKVSHKSIACIECQKKRRKCNGVEGSPCSECVKLGVPCVFDKDSDRRRRPQRERARKDQQLLHKLFDALKTWPEQDTLPLLQAIHRDGASIKDLEDFLDSSFLQPLSADNETSKASADLTDDVYNDPSSYKTESESIHLNSGAPDMSAHMSGSVTDDSTWGTWASQTGGSGAAAEAARSLQDGHMFSGVASDQYPPAIQRQQIDMVNRPEYLATPTIVNVSSQTEPLTKSALSFLYTARSRIAQGESVAKILSLDGLDLELYFRQRRPDDPHTVSTWACEFARAFAELPFPLHMNIIHTVGTFMRWLILPCQETWEKMNRLMRPLDSQVLTPHQSLYADLCHIPQLRLAQLEHGISIEELIARPNWVDCNWKLDNLACVEVDERSGTTRLSPTFVEHINDMRNWSVHRSVLDIFPEVGETDNRVNLHDDDKDDELSQKALN